MKNKFLITVIDGQGGGIGKNIVEMLVQEIKPHYEDVIIRALGTNSLATTKMLRAGATDGATGENAIIYNVNQADLIIGVMGIVMPNALLGELTPAMAEAIGMSQAFRILIPMDRCHTTIVMTAEGTLTQYIEKAVLLVKQHLANFVK